MSNKVIKGKVNGGSEGYTVESDGIYEGSKLIVSLSVNRVTLFVDQGYLGLFSLSKGDVFHFSHTDIKYRYFVGSKTLSIIFDSSKI